MDIKRDHSPAATPSPRGAGVERLQWLLMGLGVVIALALAALLALRICGIVRWYSISAQGMAPALSPGDRFFAMNVRPHSRPIHRGDIILFRTDGIHGLSPGAIYIKRVAAEPGERLALTGGRLFINGRPTILSNSYGKISMNLPQPLQGKRLEMNGGIPRGCYYVLGDDSTNSFDSRYWGCVPGGNILGRAVFRYWPPSRIGRIR